MRLLHIILAGGLAVSMLVAGAAHAQPPAPPAGPAIPILGDPGAILPEIQRQIDQILPPPPIAPPPSDAPDLRANDLAPDLAALRHAVLPSPSGDPLFDNWPADLANYSPGHILEFRDVTATAGLLVTVPIRRALLMKYRSTDAQGRPSFATATLVEPAAAWSGAGERPVVVNNLPIDALGRDCTVGYSMAHGLTLHSSLTDFIPPSTQLALLRGYAVLLPDHQGPWMAYAEPYVAGHAILDGIRAVRGLEPGAYTASKFAMTGYSGGAIATHGAVKLIEPYAPELRSAVVGAALGGVPADYELLARSMNANLASGVFMAAVLAIGRERPEILARMNNLARWVATSPMKDQCVSVFAAPGVLHLPIDIGANIPDPLNSSLAHDIYQVTRMPGMRSGTPLFIYHGAQEFWLPEQGAKALYAEQCTLGVSAVYRRVLGEHLIAAATGYPEMLHWLDQRLQGVPAPNEC